MKIKCCSMYHHTSNVSQSSHQCFSPCEREPPPIRDKEASKSSQPWTRQLDYDAVSVYTLDRSTYAPTGSSSFAGSELNGHNDQDIRQGIEVKHSAHFGAKLFLHRMTSIMSVVSTRFPFRNSKNNAGSSDGNACSQTQQRRHRSDGKDWE
jgi:hypothetical protein